MTDSTRWRFFWKQVELILVLGMTSTKITWGGDSAFNYSIKASDPLSKHNLITWGEDLTAKSGFKFKLWF